MLQYGGVAPVDDIASPLREGWFFVVVVFAFREIDNYGFNDDDHVILFHSAWETTAPRSLPLCVNKLHVHIFKRQISEGISVDTWVVQ